MLNFKEYLKENDLLSSINDNLDELSSEEISEFGEYLYDTYFSFEEEEEKITVTIDELKEIIEELGVEYYSEILNALSVDMELEEGVSRIMKKSNQNRKKRKFMKNSKAQLRKTKSVRKKLNRQSRSKRKRYGRANKAKKASYQKSRSAAIKKGKHIVKRRRNT